MIPDYKFSDSRGRRRRKGGRHILLASLVLAGTFAAVRFLDLGAPAAVEAAPQAALQPVTQTLLLPGQSAARDVTPPQVAASATAPLPRAKTTINEPVPAQAPVDLPVADTAADESDADVAQPPSLLAALTGPAPVAVAPAPSVLNEHVPAAAPQTIVVPDVAPTPVEAALQRAGSNTRSPRASRWRRSFPRSRWNPRCCRIVNSDKRGKKLAADPPGQTSASSSTTTTN